MARKGIDYATALQELIKRVSDARVVLDLVPHNMYEVIDRTEFREFCKSHEHYGIIGEVPTIAALICGTTMSAPTVDLLDQCGRRLRSTWLVLRYGSGNIGVQDVYRQVHGRFELVRTAPTNYEHLQASARVGFGDSLTADLFNEYFLQNT
jgi:hypothetical protein